MLELRDVLHETDLSQGDRVRLKSNTTAKGSVHETLPGRVLVNWDISGRSLEMTSDILLEYREDTSYNRQHNWKSCRKQELCYKAEAQIEPEQNVEVNTAIHRSTRKIRAILRDAKRESECLLLTPTREKKKIGRPRKIKALTQSKSEVIIPEKPSVDIDPKEILVTSAHCLGVLQISRAMLTKHIKNNRLHPIRVGTRKLLFLNSELLSLAQSLRQR